MINYSGQQKGQTSKGIQDLLFMNITKGVAQNKDKVEGCVFIVCV